MDMEYYIIATHQLRDAIKSIRYITSLNDSRIIYEKTIENVIQDIKNDIKIFTATRNTDDSYKMGASVIVRNDHLITKGNTKSKDNLDNLPRY